MGRFGAAVLALTGFGAGRFGADHYNECYVWYSIMIYLFYIQSEINSRSANQ